MVATVIATASDRTRVFYLAMGVGLSAIVAAGFGPGYYARLSGAASSAGAAPLPAFVHVHAALFAGWMLLLIAQAGLIARERLSLHRTLGTVSALLLPPMLWLGYRTAVYGAQHGHPFANGKAVDVPFADGYGFLIVPLADLLLFVGFVAAALYFRRRPEWHKRLMVLAVIGGFLWPAITRIPHVVGNLPLMFGVLCVPLAAALLYDLKTRGRPHAANVIGTVAIVASLPLRQAIGGTQAWHDLAVWLTS